MASPNSHSYNAIFEAWLSKRGLDRIEKLVAWEAWQAALFYGPVDEGMKALAKDSIRWMALCERVDSMDIATVVMGAQTSKARREGFETLTDKYLPDACRATSELDRPFDCHYIGDWEKCDKEMCRREKTCRRRTT